jgi:hypothetical protein
MYSSGYIQSDLYDYLQKDGAQSLLEHNFEQNTGYHHVQI